MPCPARALGAAVELAPRRWPAHGQDDYPATKNSIGVWHRPNRAPATNLFNDLVNLDVSSIRFWVAHG